MKVKVLTLLFMALLFNFSYAQQIIRSSINAFGGIVQNNEIKLSHTAGQGSPHSVIKKNAVELRQGFQQVNTKVTSNRNKTLNYTVYPNPNKGSFSIVFEKRIAGEVKYRLIDNQGRIYASDTFTASGTNHLNYTLPSGSYILQLTSPEGKSGISKIIILP